MADANTNTWDENLDAQESPDIRAGIAAAEDEVFLRDVFGVYLPENIQAPDIAKKVAHRVVNVIDQTRTSVNQAQLQSVLEANIQAGLTRTRANATPVAPRNLSGLMDVQRMRNIRTVVEAIRESVPSNVMNDVLRYGLPSFVPKEPNRPPHILVLRDVDLNLVDPTSGKPAGMERRNVEIDTRVDFWRQQYALNPSGTPPIDAIRTQLIAALVTNRGRLATLGIRILGAPPISENTVVVDDATVDNILNGKDVGVDLTKRYNDVTHVCTSVTPPITFRVNTANLVRHRDGTGNLIAAYTSPAQLETAFTTDDNDIQDFVIMDPEDALATPAVWLEVAQAVFTAVQGGGPSLAMQEMELRNVQGQIGEQHRFHTALREGSDNQMAAAFASSILMKYKDIRGVLGMGNLAEAQTNLSLERQRLSLVKLIDSVSSISFSIPFDLSAVAGLRADCVTSRGNLTPGGTLTFGVETYNIPVIANPAQQLDAIQTGRKWIEDKEKEIDRVQTECRNLAAKLRPIAQAIAAITGSHGTNPAIMQLFTVGSFAMDPAFFTQNISVPTLVQEVSNLAQLNLKSVAEHEEEAKRLDGELKKIQKGDIPKGAQAQHLVIKQYLIKYHGMTDDEANRGANVIRGRSLLDTQMTQAVADISVSMDGDYTDANADRERFMGKQERDKVRIKNVAKAGRIPTDSDGNPQWNGARSYQDLMAAYFALKQMQSGSGVSWMCRLSGSDYEKKQMHEIRRAILLKHTKAMLADFGPSMNITDDKQKLILKDPSKSEHIALLEQMLDSEVPANHKGKVDKILGAVDKSTFRRRRALGNSMFGENYGLITGNKLGISGKNLLYGNKNLSVVGAATGTKNAAVGTVKGIWNNKATIAKVGALTLLGGGVGLAIGLAAYGGDFGKSQAA